MAGQFAPLPLQMNLMAGVTRKAYAKRTELLSLLTDEHSPLAALEHWLDKVLLVGGQGHTAACRAEVRRLQANVAH
jgi:hypothetical protein